MVTFQVAFAKSEDVLDLSADKWVSLTYNKIPGNTIIFEDNQMRVKVNSSAGPIVYKLNQKTQVIEVRVKGKWAGNKLIESGDFDEDSILRLGLVAVGTKTLTGPKKWFAADWVKKLFSLAPEGLGLDKIYFLNVSNRKNLLGKKRVHPKSELIQESIVEIVSKEGEFSFSKKLDAPMNIAAVWLSIDGDDTKSKFETRLTELQLKLAE